MINELKFIANDFATNCYGFKVDTAGIDLSRHTNTNTTPAFYNHDRSEMPLGIWKSFEKVGGKLIATGLDLDMQDDCAVEMARKIELGHLNSVSMGLIVKEFKKIGEDIVATKSELLELSIVDVPANPNAVRLYEMNAEGNLVQLSITEFENQKLKNFALNIEDVLPPTQNEKMENVTKEQFDKLSLRMDTLETETLTLKVENAQLKADLATEKESKVTVKELLSSLSQREMSHPKTANTLLERVEAYKNLTFMQIYKKKDEKGDEFLADLKIQYPEEHAKIMSRK